MEIKVHFFGNPAFWAFSLDKWSFFSYIHWCEFDSIFLLTAVVSKAREPHGMHPRYCAGGVFVNQTGAVMKVGTERPKNGFGGFCGSVDWGICVHCGEPIVHYHVGHSFVFHKEDTDGESGYYCSPRKESCATPDINDPTYRKRFRERFKGRNPEKVPDIFAGNNLLNPDIPTGEYDEMISESVKHGNDQRYVDGSDCFEHLPTGPAEKSSPV